jgi:hypothetical protein
MKDENHRNGADEDEDADEEEEENESRRFGRRAE